MYILSTIISLRIRHQALAKLEMFSTSIEWQCLLGGGQEKQSQTHVLRMNNEEIWLTFKAAFLVAKAIVVQRASQGRP